MAQRKKAKACFAFLVHSRDITDVYRKFSFAKKVPDKILELWCQHSPPIVVSRVDFFLKPRSRKPVEGYIIGIPMTARQMMDNRRLAKKRVLQAVRRAEKFGANIVGLGALTSSVTGGGKLIRDKIKAKIICGHAYTAYTVSSYVLKVIKEKKYAKGNVKLAIVGSAGSIGSACAQYLLKKRVKNILLVDLKRKKKRLSDQLKKLKNIAKNSSIKVTHKINDIKRSDIVIAATNAPDALIKPNDLKKGAIIIDDAQPSDISPEVAKKRKDVLIIDGGVLSVPRIDLNFNFGLAKRNNIYSCLGEVLIYAVTPKLKVYQPEDIDYKKIEEIGKYGLAHGFKVDNYQRFGKIHKYVKKCYNNKI